MNKPESDYYLDLGISQSASASEVKKAYRRLAIIHHPDKKAPGENIDAAEFRKIHDAYEVLSDTTRRAQYNRRYAEIQRRWTQYRKWEEKEIEAEEDRRAKEDDMKRKAESAERLRRVEEMWRKIEAQRQREMWAKIQAEGQKVEEEAQRAKPREEADAAPKENAAAITPCVHPHIGKVWWKNGKADCSFCGDEGTYCFGCPVCDIKACHDCRDDLAP